MQIYHYNDPARSVANDIHVISLKKYRAVTELFLAHWKL